jgi:hypothetical protein
VPTSLKFQSFAYVLSNQGIAEFVRQGTSVKKGAPLRTSVAKAQHTIVNLAKSAGYLLNAWAFLPHEAIGGYFTPTMLISCTL